METGDVAAVGLVVLALAYLARRMRRRFRPPPEQADVTHVELSLPRRRKPS